MNMSAIRSISNWARSAFGIAVLAGAIVAVALSVILGIGWHGAADAAAAKGHTISKLQASADDAQKELASKDDELSGYIAREAEVQGEAAQNDTDAARIKRDRAKVDAAEAKLKKDEAAFEKSQKVVASSQLSDGVHVIGADTNPGVYRITDSSDCYYVWKTSTGSDADIVDNNIVSGPATVTLTPGQVFETQGCGTWDKIG